MLRAAKNEGVSQINRWIVKVKKSGINILKNTKKIANYFKAYKSSGFIEELNNKIKVMKYICYGFGSAVSYF